MTIEIVIGFGISLFATMLTGVGVVWVIVRYANDIRLELKDDVKEVQRASEAAHTQINDKLDALNEKAANIDKQVGVLTERVDCVVERIEKNRESLGQRLRALPACPRYGLSMRGFSCIHEDKMR